MKKTVKLFPAPHVEVRIHVSDEMEKDLQECQKAGDADIGKNCETCSWHLVEWETTGMCELPAVVEKILEEKQDGEEDKVQ